MRLDRRHGLGVRPGIVKLRDAALGAAARPSWAVVLPSPNGAIGPGTTLETPALRVEVDAQCRVRATLADGTARRAPSTIHATSDTTTAPSTSACSTSRDFRGR
jgi:hypothetical protein